ncbi:MAG TPA: hypothetical protein VGF84_03895, partial [Micromonosporaceae bacterium]
VTVDPRITPTESTRVAPQDDRKGYGFRGLDAVLKTSGPALALSGRPGRVIGLSVIATNGGPGTRGIPRANGVPQGNGGNATLELTLDAAGLAAQYLVEVVPGSGRHDGQAKITVDGQGVILGE